MLGSVSYYPADFLAVFPLLFQEILCGRAGEASIAISREVLTFAFLKVTATLNEDNWQESISFIGGCY